MAELDRDQEEAAAREAGAIGGSGSGLDPLEEAGQGESEGFEQAEEALIDRASHGDQHAARRVVGDADPRAEPDAADGVRYGDADGDPDDPER